MEADYDVESEVLRTSPVTVAGALAFGATGASALTVAECSAKYKAAKAADTLAGKTWNEFRAAECTDAAAAADTKPAAPKPAEAKVTPKPATTAGSAVFPKAISSKYATEPPARRACTPAATSTTPTRRPMPTAA